jgi:hypothetical protein
MKINLYDQQPPRLRAFLKTVPAILLVAGFAVLLKFMMTSFLHHSNDHIRRQRHKMSTMERHMLNRDDRIRYAYTPMLEYDPNIKTPGLFDGVVYPVSMNHIK